MRTLLTLLLLTLCPPLLATATVWFAEEIDISVLTGIEYKRGRALPDEVNDLNGKEITLEGYMALGTLEGASMFELVPEECECGRSKVQHFIEVTLLDDVVAYTPGRITITGKIDIGEKEEDGFIVSLYRMEIERLP